MSDEKTPKDLADQLRGLADRAREQGRNMKAAGVQVRGDDKVQAPAPARGEENPGERDRHRHIKDTQQENLVQQSSAGYGVQQAEPQQTKENEQAKEAVAKGAEKTPEGKAPTASPAEVAERLRAQGQQSERASASRAESTSRAELGNMSPGQTPAQTRSGQDRSESGPNR